MFRSPVNMQSRVHGRFGENDGNDNSVDYPVRIPNTGNDNPASRLLRRNRFLREIQQLREEQTCKQAELATVFTTTGCEDPFVTGKLL